MMYLLAYKSKAGNFIYLGFANGKPSSVGGKELATKFNSAAEANEYKKNMSVNDRYQAVKNV